MPGPSPPSCGRSASPDRRVRLRCPRRLHRLALGKKYQQAARVWAQAWDDFTPFLAFSPPVRKMLCATSSIESPSYQLRKVTNARGRFPSDDAVVKLLGAAIINIEGKRAREREARRQQTGRRSNQPGRIAEGQRVMGWREALSELDNAYFPRTKMSQLIQIIQKYLHI